ncbi:hypothetical protein J6253_04125 [bacterium]|nr:hypothetical protein [bacterium]MBP5591299.1 hypothetical protein [bacterium]
MKKSVLIMVVFAVFFAFSAVSCGEKQTVDERANVKELVAKGEYQQAKAKLVTLRGQYPNDQELTELNRQVDEKIAESFYQKYWDEAEQKGDHKAWIEAMIRIKKVENINKEMVNGWIKRAAEKCVDAGAKNLNDGMLLALLDQLVQRYQVITMNDRLMYITMFVKEGRFPLKEWKDTFLTKYPELMDEDTDEFLGWPRPEKPAKK